MSSIVAGLGRTFQYVILAGLLIWCAAALWFDGRPGLTAFFPALLLIFWRIRGRKPRFLTLFATVGVGLVWWLRIRATNEADGQPAVARVATAQVDEAA